MRTALKFALLPLVLAGSVAARPVSGEEALTRELAGRAAGEPVDCIDLTRTTSSRMIPGTAIVYRVGSTLYVNRPRSGADSLNRWDMMVVTLPQSRLCRIDTVRIVDPHSGAMTGIVFLGDFVPYRRVRN